MKKVLLAILDGWGLGDHSHADAVFAARTPVMDQILASNPHARLLTHGAHVGLPEGQMGNSEVGHLNIGAGRVVYQDLERINKAIADGSFAQNPALQEAFHLAKSENRPLHLIGLVSDGGVHSSLEHILHLCSLAAKQSLPHVYVHAITDGRDTDPRSGKLFLQSLQEALEGTQVKIASVIGRYYAMDRDKRWERVKLAYDLLTKGKGTQAETVQAVFDASYAANVTDEFILPHTIQGAFAPVQENDLVICFNFRTDRCREITQVLTQQSFPDWGMHPLRLHYYTMTHYDESFRNVGVLFNKDNLSNTLGEVVAKNGLSQLRIAETEKYPHVTFFFSGGREEPFSGESRILIPSPKVATYDLQPGMSAPEITDKAILAIREQNPDFICLNYANADMVGHTGVYTAIVEAIETVDTCLGRLLDAATAKGYSVLVIADHGNADVAVNPDGSPNTAHSLNPVPCVLLNTDRTRLHDGCLADVAPTLLELMQLPVPAEMNGTSLIG